MARTRSSSRSNDIRPQRGLIHGEYLNSVLDVIRFPWIWRNYIVILSSSFSVLWHLYGEPKNLIFYFDYLFATAWFLVEIFQTRSRDLKNVVALNTIVFITNLCIKYNTNYWFYHSLWHILSSAKYFYISRGCRVSNVSSSPYHA